MYYNDVIVTYNDLYITISTYRECMKDVSYNRDIVLVFISIKKILTYYSYANKT